MAEWWQDTNEEFIRRDEAREKSKRLRAHKAAVIQDWGSHCFSELKRSAEEGVASLKSARREFADVVFETVGSGSFIVKNPVYPTAIVTVTLLTVGIQFATTRQANAHSTAKREKSVIAFDVDANDNLLLKLDGETIANKDDALKIMLRPILER